MKILFLITAILMGTTMMANANPYQVLYYEFSIPVNNNTIALESVITGVIANDIEDQLELLVLPTVIPGIITDLIIAVENDLSITRCESIELIERNIEQHNLLSKVVQLMNGEGPSRFSMLLIR